MIADKALKKAYSMEMAPSSQLICKALIDRTHFIVESALEEQKKTIKRKVSSLHADFVIRSQYETSLYHFNWFLERTIKIIDRNYTPLGLLQEAKLDLIMLQAIDKITLIDRRIKLKVAGQIPPQIQARKRKLTKNRSKGGSGKSRASPLPQNGMQLDLGPSSSLTLQQARQVLLERLDCIIAAAQEEEERPSGQRTLVSLYIRFMGKAKVNMPKDRFNSFMREMAQELNSFFTPCELLERGGLSKAVKRFQGLMTESVKRDPSI
jgi:hypothetical protein